MKKDIIKKLTIGLSLICLLSACNDSYLDRQPTHDLDNNMYWDSEAYLKAYNNGIYNEAASRYNVIMLAYNQTASASKSNSFVTREVMTDNFASNDGDLGKWASIGAGIHTIPDNAPKDNQEATTTGRGWNWVLLRKCNFFFENYNRATSVDQDKKNRYAGEVYFFRAWFYLDKVQEYGNVPLILKALDVDSPELFATQEKREVVMDTVLADINKAIDYLPEKWPDGNGSRVTKLTAYALKSRICLYEGTFRKYHGLTGYEKFLTEAVDASEKLIKTQKYSVYDTGNPDKDYRTLFTTDDLTTNPEVILARVYAQPGLGHGMSRNLGTLQAGATQDFVEDFLCIEADGTAKPVALSSVYKDDAIENVFDNRDPRLAQTVLDPRKAKEVINSSAKDFPRLPGMGSGFQTSTGYHFIKNYSYDEAQRSIGSEVNDFPLLRYAEVLLNYAEAKAELGAITQADLDMSINKIRDRVNMPHLTIDPPMDPKYASEGISPLLVEIRRERRVELSFENIRFQDLMRWKKGSYLKKPQLGMRVNDVDFQSGGRYEKAKVSFTTVNGKKYIDVYAGKSISTEKRVFDETKHYWQPIPINVIAKNPNLIQNNGWVQ